MKIQSKRSVQSIFFVTTLFAATTSAQLSLPVAAAKPDTPPISTKIERFAQQKRNVVEDFGKAVTVLCQDGYRLNFETAVFCTTGPAQSDTAYGVHIDRPAVYGGEKDEEAYIDYDDAKVVIRTLNVMMQQAAGDKVSKNGHNDQGDATIEFDLSTPSRIRFGYLQEDRKAATAFVVINRKRVFLDMTKVAELQAALTRVVKDLEREGASGTTSRAAVGAKSVTNAGQATGKASD